MVTVIAAMTFLMLSSLASILLPNFEGTILDQVIKMDMSGFHKYIFLFFFFNYSSNNIVRYIILYIVANALCGLFNSIQSFCFNYVGSQLLYDIQVALLHNVLKQDIAFFDGYTNNNNNKIK